jgi:glycine/D-amino acid oxidase-like deaminating enzyme
MRPDVVVIGGGIAGCAAAAFLAEGGARVRLYEREAIGAGASGRNSGILQHPMDPVLEPLYEASLREYESLGHGFAFPPEPAGAMVVSRHPEALAADYDAAAARFPGLAAEWLEGAALEAAEPALAPGVYAYRLATGRPVPPAAATRAWAARAQAAGAELVIGEEPTITGDHADGAVRLDGVAGGAEAVVVAAGPWSAAALGAALPVRAVWGVVAQVRLAEPPRHPLEESGVEALTAPGGAPTELFSIVTAGGASAVGSTFTPEEPDPAAVAPGLLARGARYVPALEHARIESVRACARPLAADGRPLLGPMPGRPGVHLLTGHGAWGISLGPASARLVAGAVLGEGAAIAPELAAARDLSLDTTTRSSPLP